MKVNFLVGFSLLCFSLEMSQTIGFCHFGCHKIKLGIFFAETFWEVENDGQSGELCLYFNVQKLEKYSKVPNEKIVTLNNLVIIHILTSTDQRNKAM